MEEKELSILAISDIHEDKNNLLKLVEKFKSSENKFDFILCCGDIVTIKDPNQDKEEFIQKYDPLIKEEIEILCQIPHNKNVFYLPGNHDSKTLVDNKIQLVENALNLHKKIERIGNNLYILGLGGSTPIIGGKQFQSGISPYSDLDTKNVLYMGYPYNYLDDPNNYEKSDEDFGRDLEELLKEVKEKAKSEGNNNPNILLFTHMGPRGVWTNYAPIKGINCYLGSKKEEDIFFREEGIFLNIHGHTHESRGLSEVDDTKYVLNPGALKKGQYATLKIKMNAEGKWILLDNYFGQLE